MPPPRPRRASEWGPHSLALTRRSLYFAALRIRGFGWEDSPVFELPNDAIASTGSGSSDLGPRRSAHSVRCHWQHVHLHARRLSLGADNPLRRRLEILRLRGRDVHEGLWIAIHQRKPAALYLHHDAVAATKHVIYIGHREVHGFNASRRKRLGLLEALPKLSAKGPPAHELLIPREPHHRRADVRPSPRPALGCGIAPVRRIDIDQFHHPVGISPGRRNEEPC